MSEHTVEAVEHPVGGVEGMRPSDRPQPVVGRAGMLARWRSAFGFPVLCFLGVAVVLFTTAWVSTTFMTRNFWYPEQPVVFRGARVLEGWARYDAGWYVQITANGYSYRPGQMSSVAFFPSYPLAARLVYLLTRDYVLSGIVLTFFSGMGVSILFYRWCCAQLSRSVARLAVAMLLVFPYAWYLYGAIYADAFFLLCTLTAFVLIQRDHPVAAGLIAAVATAARPVGVAVFLGLLLVELDRRKVIVIPFFDRVRQVGWRQAWSEWRGTTESTASTDAGAVTVAGAAIDSHPEGRRVRGRWFGLSLGRLRPGSAGVLLSMGGLAAWAWYLGTTYGDPFLFAGVQNVPGWDQGQGPRTWFKFHWLGYLHHMPEYLADSVNAWPKLTYGLGITFQALLVAAFVLMIPLVIRRVGWPYAVYVAAIVGIPILGSKDWQGTGRYVLAAFPVFAAAASWLLNADPADPGEIRQAGQASQIPARRRRLRYGLLVLSALMLVFLTSAFARGYYLA